MRHDFLKKMETFLKNGKKRRTAQGIAAVLAVAMAVTTTNAMILPAISLEKKAAEGDAAIFLEDAATASNAKKKSEGTRNTGKVVVKATASNPIEAVIVETETDSNAVMAATNSNAQKDPIERVYRDDEIEVTVTYSEAANIPEEAEFVVERLEPGEFPEKIEKMTGEEYAKLQETEKEPETEEKTGVRKTLEEVEAFIKSLLNTDEQEAEETEIPETEALETEEETLASIRLNVEEESEAEIETTAEGALEGTETENAAEVVSETAELTEVQGEEQEAEAPELPALRYKIGFYLDGIEIEPQDTVSLSVRFFTEEFTQAEGVQVTHYLDNHEDADTETFEPDTEIDEDGSMKAVFAMDSFSVVEFTAVGRAATQADAQFHIYFYVCVDNEWVLVEEKESVDAIKRYDGKNQRYYISGTDLEAVYGTYGYKAATDQAGKCLFAHTDINSEKIWYDGKMLVENEEIYNPILMGVRACEVYYLPATGYVSHDSQDKNNFLQTDTFYSVKRNGEIQAYILAGKDGSVTLEKGETSDLVAIGKDGTEIAAVENPNGTLTFSFKNMAQPYVIQQRGAYSVTYDVEGSFERAGLQYGPELQTWKDTDVSVTGLNGGIYEEIVGEYVVREISADTRIATARYPVTGNTLQGEILFTYAFQGWRRSDTNEIVKPGEKITLNQNITLTAVWCVHLTHDDEKCIADEYDLNHSTITGNFNLASAAFYLMIVDDAGTSITNSGNYTDCLYTTRVIEGEKSWANDKKWDAICGPDDGGKTLVDETNEQIRAEAESGITKDGYTVRLENFPSDDEIFRRIRSWSERAQGVDTSITVNKVRYSLEEINADNFEIKWFVLKPSYFNTWHVDGKLVPRKAKLTITKTFVGDSEAIQDVTRDGSTYAIKVSSTADSKSPYTLKLQPYSSENPTGYVKKENNTYSWLLEGLVPETQYVVEEENYAVKDYTTTINYQISQSKDKDVDTAGWSAYSPDSGITVGKCYSYQDNVLPDNYQTVALRNVYTKPFVLTLLKQDGTTYHGLSGVEFNLTLEKDDKTTYSGVVKSDDSGNITVDFRSFNGVVLGSGTYKFNLEEQKLCGYDSAITVSGAVKIDKNGKVTVDKSSIETSVSGENKTAYVDEVNSSLIYIINHSKRTSVKVTKVWTDDTNKSVAMQLMRNGALVPGNEVWLDGGSDGWTYTWDDLPLYVDGAKANYNVRETWIGKPDEADGASYTSGDDADGYSGYIVEQLAEKKKDETTEGTFTEVTVWNTVDRGQVTFTKVNDSGERLAGAEFTVYVDQDCDTVAQCTVNGIGQAAIFQSNDSGIVTIEGLPVGTYYVKETKAPQGYALSDKVYTLIARKNNSSLTYEGVEISQIVNEALRLSLWIQKVTTQGDSTVGLAGAEFALYDENNYSKYTGEGSSSAEAIKTWTSSENSQEIGDLTAGKYYLVEITAPDGYNLLTGPVVITISVGEDNTILTEAQGTSEGVAYVEADDPRTVYVRNTPGRQLPNTGGSGSNLYKYGGLLFMAVAVVCGYMLKRRRERGAV